MEYRIKDSLGISKSEILLLMLFFLRKVLEYITHQQHQGKHGMQEVLGLTHQSSPVMTHIYLCEGVESNQFKLKQGAQSFKKEELKK